jgi:hypothetical protein
MLAAATIAVSPSLAAKKKVHGKAVPAAGTKKEELCCAKFNPKAWDGKILTWKNKRFIKDRVREVFHIPLNFAAVVARMDEKARAAKAAVKQKDWLLLADENSLWGADLYLAVKKDVPSAGNVKMSGKFLCKVFEGQYKNMKSWIKTMNEYVTSRRKTAKKLYFFYATCPKCAKALGKNYVVILAEI